MTWDRALLYLLVVWLSGITVFLVWLFKHINRLTQGVRGGDLIKLFDKIFEKQKELEKASVELTRELKRIDQESLSHIQKIGFVRFNPFEETGGDHSFSLALLDGRINGFVITGLHTRERTRLYVKQIRNGKSEHELSVEENRALAVARKN